MIFSTLIEICNSGKFS